METPVRSPETGHKRDPEQVARDMEAKKQELLNVKDELRDLMSPRVIQASVVRRHH